MVVGLREQGIDDAPTGLVFEHRIPTMILLGGTEVLFAREVGVNDPQGRIILPTRCIHGYAL